MDIRQLRYLLRTIEHRSFAAAAETLHIAPSALGVQVRNLEDELGVDLLTRHARGVTPTHAGSILAAHATRILDAMDTAMRETRQSVQESPTGHITLGLTPPINDFLSIPLLHALRDAYPGLTVALSEAPSTTLGEQVQRGRLDLACVYDLESCEGLPYDLLLQDELVYLQRALPESDVGPISFDTAAQSPLVLPAQPHGSRALLEREAAHRRLQLNVVYEVQSLQSVREMVLRGDVATIVPFASAARHVDNANYCIRPIVDPQISRPLWLVRNPRSDSERSLLDGVVDILTRKLTEEITLARARWQVGRSPDQSITM